MPHAKSVRRARSPKQTSSISYVRMFRIRDSKTNRLFALRSSELKQCDRVGMVAHGVHHLCLLANDRPDESSARWYCPDCKVM